MTRGLWRWRQLPTASPTHFLTWLVLAAPASFLSAADLLHAADASFSHLVMNDFRAAPASFFCSAWALQVGPGAWAPTAVAARTSMATAARYLMASLVEHLSQQPRHAKMNHR